MAEGRIDGFVDIRGRMRVMDLAAAYLIGRQAGAIFSDGGGGGSQSEDNCEGEVQRCGRRELGATREDPREAERASATLADTDGVEELPYAVIHGDVRVLGVLPVGPDHGEGDSDPALPRSGRSACLLRRGSTPSLLSCPPARTAPVRHGRANLPG